MCIEINIIIKVLIMIKFSKDEIQSSTQISRQFGSILDKLKSKSLDKVAILRNNTMEAVIIPIDEYEKMQNFIEMTENIEIYNMLKNRIETPIEKFIDLDSMLNQIGIDRNEL